MKNRIIVLLLLLLCASYSHAAPELRVDRLGFVFPGDRVAVGLRLVDSDTVFESGGFELVVMYDTSLSLVSVTPGQFLGDCQWEYFYYTAIDTYVQRITAIADINNGPVHPTCYTDPDAQLAVLTFDVPFDLNLIGEFLSVRFKWYDCGDNGVSNRIGDRLFISNEVYHFDGEIEYLITGDTTLPSLLGAPSFCIPNDTAARIIDFHDGGVSLANRDITPPTAHCPGDTVITATYSQCGRQVYFDATVTDDRPGATIGCLPPSGMLFPVGTTTVTCTAIDAAGNRDTCQFTITVVDNQPPELQCPDTIFAEAAPGLCGASVSYAIPATDNCPDVVVTTTRSSGSHFMIGSTPVDVIAVDASGNADSCTFIVTVTDTQAPTALCQSDTTVATDSDACGAIVSFDLTGTDNCPALTMSSAPPSGAYFPLGTSPVEVVATDWTGQTDTCLFTVTVVDSQPPSFSCPDLISVPNDAGECGAAVPFDLGLSDNCGVAELTITAESGSFFPIGTTGVTAIATDSAGNAGFCTFCIEVVDTEPPVVQCPDTIFAETDPGACGAVVDFAPAADDNCGVVDLTTSIAPGSFFETGPSDVAVVAIDAAGLRDSCRLTIVVTDTEPPVVTCPDDITVLNDSGFYAARVYFEIVSDDNCGDAEVTTEPPSGSTFPIGTTTVTATGSDDAGNETIETFGVTVVLNDPDSDGLPSWADNCPETANPDQADTDSNGVGDACCCENRGNVNGQPSTGSCINVSDLTYLVAYLMAGGPAPPCPSEADVNGNAVSGGTVNISDVTYLVAYLFASGPPPPPC